MRRPKAQLSTLTGAHVLLLAAGALAVILAVTLSIPAMRAQIERATAAHAAAARVEQQVSDASRIGTDKKIAAAAAAVKKQIPATADLEELIVQLQRAVSATGAHWVGSKIVTAPATDVGADSDSRTVDTWVVTVQLKSDLRQLGAVLARLPKLERLVVVDSVVTAGPGATESSVTMRVFALTEKE